MKKLKLTNLIISSGIILTLSIGLIAYNSNKETNLETATSTSESNTSNDNSTSEELPQITETQVNSAEVVQSEQTNAAATASTNQTANAANRSSSNPTTTNNSNTNTDNSNNSTDVEQTEPNINIDNSNNSTSLTPEQKPEINKPVTNTPTTPPSNDNNSNTTTPSASFIAEIEQAIFQQVNAEREKAGVPALSYNNTMQKYARIKSQDMGDRNYFAHENPEGQLITVQMQKDGVSYQAWGENIAYIQSSSSNSSLASQFMTNWMNSSGHRANILSTNFSSIGIGIYKIGTTYYATQEFYR